MSEETQGVPLLVVKLTELEATAAELRVVTRAHQHLRQLAAETKAGHGVLLPVQLSGMKIEMAITSDSFADAMNRSSLQIIALWQRLKEIADAGVAHCQAAPQLAPEAAELPQPPAAPTEMGEAMAAAIEQLQQPETGPFVIQQ
jgi:hypothetical protein